MLIQQCFFGVCCSDATKGTPDTFASDPNVPQNKDALSVSRSLLLVNSFIIVSLTRLGISEISVATNFTVEATTISSTLSTTV